VRLLAAVVGGLQLLTRSFAVGAWWVARAANGRYFAVPWVTPGTLCVVPLATPGAVDRDNLPLIIQVRTPLSRHTSSCACPIPRWEYLLFDDGRGDGCNRMTRPQ
jgi:hypothetical protein